ncbi:MAG: class I SAM-dependent methyltransferase [Candidatus ainarchaeum sp.]|nr:class I SAM-dependent methyltransferase [Candidatus ainarchaeum sp.]
MPKRQAKSGGLACKACGKPLGAKFFSSCDINFLTDGVEYDVYKCGECGLACLPEPPKDIERYYGSHYGPPAAQTEPGAAVSLAKKIGRIFRANRQPLPRLASDPKFKDILEVGCGTGLLMRLVRERNPAARMTGIEMRGPASREAKASGLHVLEGDFFEIAKKMRGGKYDLVVLNHVLEHLADPVVALGECRRILKDGGEALVVVPNVEGVSCRLFGAKAEPYDVPRHLWGFTAKSIRMLAERAGFKADVKTFSENSFLLNSLMNKMGVKRPAYYSLRKNPGINLAWHGSEFVLSWAMLGPDAISIGDQLLARLKKA